jgi:hypothetical protein
MRRIATEPYRELKGDEYSSMSRSISMTVPPSAFGGVHRDQTRMIPDGIMRHFWDCDNLRFRTKAPSADQGK